jgi:DNA-binding response OmpR family regulator
MGYHALLFSADEKTARAVTQILRELEFTVISFAEPAAAVNKLQSQQFDAVVVDCENEQNATLLFKTARSASNNDVSLAVAVVEGQTGVARAFRIGASLVLTKPINAEQAKGTLRVARGLLRKSKAAKPATAAATDAKPAVMSVSKAAAAAAGSSAGSTSHESAQSKAVTSSGSDAAEPIIELFYAGKAR